MMITLYIYIYIYIYMYCVKIPINSQSAPPSQLPITRTYKHAPSKLETSINFETKHIASKLAFSDRMERLAKTPAYRILKDHKENFHASTPCRLINPCKSEIGKISKRLLEGINNNLPAKLNINQWRDTTQVIDWFKKLECKSKRKLIQGDIK